MDWNATISKADNGYVLYLTRMSDESTTKISICVFEDNDNENAFVNAIWELAEYFAELGSKHAKERFWVGMKKQNGS